MSTLETALAALGRSERRALAVAFTEARNKRAEAGDRAMAEVYSEVLALTMEASDAEDELLARAGQEVLDSIVRVIEDPDSPGATP